MTQIKEIIGYCANGHAHYPPTPIEGTYNYEADLICPRCGAPKRWITREDAYRAAFLHAPGARLLMYIGFVDDEEE